jgi:hypothetical protein
MDIFSRFSVARELLQWGELEQALAEVDDLRSVVDHRVGWILEPIFKLESWNLLKVFPVSG